MPVVVAHKQQLLNCFGSFSPLNIYQNKMYVRYKEKFEHHLKEVTINVINSIEYWTSWIQEHLFVSMVFQSYLLLIYVKYKFTIAAPRNRKLLSNSTPLNDNGQRLTAFTVICVVKTKKKGSTNAGIWMLEFGIYKPKANFSNAIWICIMMMWSHWMHPFRWAVCLGFMGACVCLECHSNSLE